MTVPFYRLLGQIFLATETWESTPDAKEALSKAGLNKDRIQAGKDLLARGQELAHRRIYDGVEDRIAGHATHTAAAELQMWQQTVRSALRHRGVSADAPLRFDSGGTSAPAGRVRAAGFNSVGEKMAVCGPLVVRVRRGIVVLTETLPKATTEDYAVKL